MSRPARRLVVLEEDAAHARRVETVAREQGFEVIRVANGGEFRGLALDNIHAIIIDLMVSRVDGVELMRDLAEKGFDGSVILSSDTDRRILSAAERLARARCLRVAGSLQKPLNEFALRRLLDRTVARPGAAGRALNIQVAQTELLQCMEDGFVGIRFQPKIDVRTLEFVSVEALVRLDHPLHGLLRPDAFLAMAEESGLIARLTRDVAVKALEQTAAWMMNGLPLRVAVNVSPLLLSDLSLPETFAELADRHEIRREQVILEITESWANTDSVATLDILTRLRMKGFQLAIDDFGTGYSTMAQLNELPYSEMKLDQSFIRNAARDPEARAIVESSIELGHKLGMKVVAEGVEKQEDWDLISDLHCDEGQGFFIAKPMRGDEIPAWLKHWNACLGRG